MKQRHKIKNFVIPILIVQAMNVVHWEADAGKNTVMSQHLSFQPLRKFQLYVILQMTVQARCHGVVMISIAFPLQKIVMMVNAQRMRIA